jgi:hypothetical protein
MNDHGLSLGAHLLLWVFPLALVVMVAVSSVRDARRHGGPP